jgi:hypothetical protein
MYRLFVVALFAYITLDLADPNLPGALNFDPDQSVTAISTQSRTTAPAPMLMVLSPQTVAVMIATVSPETPPQPPGPTIAPRVTWGPRPRALLSARTSASLDTH